MFPIQFDTCDICRRKFSSGFWNGKRGMLGRKYCGMACMDKERMANLADAARARRATEAHCAANGHRITCEDCGIEFRVKGEDS